MLETPRLKTLGATLGQDSCACWPKANGRGHREVARDFPVQNRVIRPFRWTDLFATVPKRSDGRQAGRGDRCTAKHTKSTKGTKASEKQAFAAILQFQLEVPVNGDRTTDHAIRERIELATPATDPLKRPGLWNFRTAFFCRALDLTTALDLTASIMAGGLMDPVGTRSRDFFQFRPSPFAILLVRSWLFPIRHRPLRSDSGHPECWAHSQRPRNFPLKSWLMLSKYPVSRRYRASGEAGYEGIVAG